MSCCSVFDRDLAMEWSANLRSNLLMSSSGGWRKRNQKAITLVSPLNALRENAGIGGSIFAELRFEERC